MPLIWGFEQCRRHAADWRDGQFAHGAHADFARRATVRVIARRKATKQSITKRTGSRRFARDHGAVRDRGLTTN
jgi:hypothetical protein